MTVDTPTSAKRPLEGLVVVDMTRALAGPFATMLLADLGANVIKVESPEGDLTRGAGPFMDDDELRAFGGYFQSINRSKRGIVIDLKTKTGTAALLRLIEKADALVENFRPGVMESFGLGYETLREHNPKLVYAAVRGFGDPRTGQGPYQDWPSFDVVAQAMGGLMAITGEPGGPPVKTGPGIGDVFPGVLATVGLLAALREASATGRGSFVDVAMYDAVLQLCERSIYQYSYTGMVAGPEGNDHAILCPFGVFPTKGQGWVALAAPVDGHWRLLCEIMGVPDLGRDPRYMRNHDRAKRRAEVRTIVERWTLQHGIEEIRSALEGRVPFGPVNAADAIFADPHVAARHMLVELEQPGSLRPAVVAGNAIRFAGVDSAPTRRAPLLGEHTDEVLAEFGFSEAEIEVFRAEQTAQ